MTEGAEKIPENAEMTRREEPTRAPTPDKFDRSTRARPSSAHSREIGVAKWKGNASENPYPFTEEEATPITPRSEQQNIHRQESGGGNRRRSSSNNNDKHQLRTDSSSKYGTRKKEKKKEGKRERTIRDYNKYVAHEERR
ncbi:MAG TPA: hypothetical protein VFF30_03425 [Nitrososphaerales archaeon]|nr:hypothetical protein [Nitrososphaerales archaeon]